MRMHTGRLAGGLAALALMLSGCGGGGPPSAAALGRAESAESAAAAKSALVGRAAPDFVLGDQDDKQVRLSDLRGQWVALYFYPKDDMPPCACDATKYTKCLMAMGDVKPVSHAITTSSARNLRAFIDTYKKDYPKLHVSLLSDREHKVLAAYGAWIPGPPGPDGEPGRVSRSTVLIDPAGVIRYHWPLVVPIGHADRVDHKFAELTAPVAPAAPAAAGSRTDAGRPGGWPIALLGGLLLCGVAAARRSPAESADELYQAIESAEEFNRLIVDADRPVLMTFYKTGCPTCVLLTPVMDRLAGEYHGRVIFAKYRHVSALMKVTSWRLLKEYGVYLVPTVILFVGGRERKRWTMRYRGGSYRKALDKALAGRLAELGGDESARGDCTGDACRID